jgi:phosphinothricin acetyltransferase
LGPAVKPLPAAGPSKPSSSFLSTVKNIPDPSKHIVGPPTGAPFAAARSNIAAGGAAVPAERLPVLPSILPLSPGKAALSPAVKPLPAAGPSKPSSSFVSTVKNIPGPSKHIVGPPPEGYNGAMIRAVGTGDAPDICEIYNYYLERTAITFEEVPVSPEEMAERIRKVTAEYPWLVWEEAGTVLGYAYVNRWKERSAYRFSVEDSVYVRAGRERRGLGWALMSALLEEVKKTTIHGIVAGISLPNPGSVALHEKAGFTQVACFKEIGYKHGNWLDVGYWELRL